MHPSVPEPGVRLSELVATLSYAADLGLGQPLAHCVRKTVIAQRMAELVSAGPADREATFYTGLMANVYCHADATEQATWFGDDIEFKGAAFNLLDMTTPQVVAALLRRTASGGNVRDRVRRVAGVTTARKRVTEFLTTHAALASQFAAQIGLGPPVVAAIRDTYEQWDGSGLPQRRRGTEISLPARLVHLSGPVEVFGRRSVEAARRITLRHRGTQFDPDLVDAFVDHAPELLDGLDDASGWDGFLGGQQAVSRVIRGSELDEVLEAMADLVDMKSPWFAGHSRGVANLAAAAAARIGTAPADVIVIRRAGLLHDLGRLGVSNAILDKYGPLSTAEFERVRLHPYLTDRMLSGISALRRSREIAGRHHERLDGSGYPHGLTAASLSPADRLLAAADAYHAMTEPRPHRAPYDTDQAGARLRAEAESGRLDEDAVNAVLGAAGHRAPARRRFPAGLTAREVEILGLLARGGTNRQIAARLVLAPKTVSNHIEHIYSKLGVTGRAAATLYATQHGLLGAYEAGE